MNLIIAVFFIIGVLTSIKWAFFGVKIENEKIICDGGNLVQACFRKWGKSGDFKKYSKKSILNYTKWSN